MSQPASATAPPAVSDSSVSGDLSAIVNRSAVMVIMLAVLPALLCLLACSSPKSPLTSVNGDRELPADSLLSLAEHGDVEAQLEVGLFFDRAEAYAEAAVWYRQAAEQGQSQAQNNLGVLYKDGQGVEQDYEEAARWFRLAAAEGSVLAQSNLAWLYQTGRGVKKDYAEARRLYLLAAENGHAAAQNNLGMMYLHGMGVAQDSDSAAHWFRLAAEQGLPLAKKNLKKLNP